MFVACRRRGSHVRLEVRDSSIGIPGDELGKVFRAFLRADATRSEGLGLGLFIVKRAADFLGHSVQVCSAVGFVGQLPRGLKIRWHLITLGSPGVLRCLEAASQWRAGEPRDHGLAIANRSRHWRPSPPHWDWWDPHWRR